MKYWLFSLFFIVGISLQATAQDRKEALQRAKSYFLQEHYKQALALIERSGKSYQREKEALFLKAVCLFQLNHLDAALDILRQLSGQDRQPYPEVSLYLGKVFHARHEFAKAADYYKAYLRSIPLQHRSRPMVREDIRRCAEGLRLRFREARAFVENLGDEVNTPQDEFGPVVSPNDPNRLYFSSARPGNIGGARDASGRPNQSYGHYRCDIFRAKNIRGKWTQTKALHHLLNGPRHDVLLDFDAAGSSMIFFQGDRYTEGRLLVDTFRRADERGLSSDPFPASFRLSAGDGSLQLVNDTMLLFSSRRSGGFGGLDLYLSVRQNGRWQAPRNLGPSVNTAYDETTPFLARDGKTLYYSSNNSAYSIGGYDIFRSVYFPEMDQWTQPENLGIPVNSAGDDTHFRLTADGFSAFFTSNRKDGLGRRDLYVAYFHEFLREQQQDLPLALLSKPTRRTSPRRRSQIRETATPEPPAAEPANHYSSPRQVEPDQPTLQAIPYRTPSQIFEAPNRALLDELAGRLRATPGLRVELRIHVKKEVASSSALFNALQGAEMAAGHLWKSGIKRHRIDLAAIYAPSSNASATPYTIELLVLDPAKASGTQSTARAADRACPMDGLRYQIQVRSLRATHFTSAFDCPMIIKEAAGNYYLYFLGNYATYRQALEGKQQLIRSGQYVSGIVPQIHGWRLSRSEARQWVEKYPDLEAFIAEGK